MVDYRLSTPALREAVFMTLYKQSFPAVARYVARMGGRLEEAQDIFQDALLVYYEKATAGQDIGNEQAYVMGVAKRLWLQHYKHRDEPLNGYDRAMELEEQPVATRVMRYLATAGRRCMELLKAHYYDSLPAGNVAEQFGYRSTHSATVAKYKCLEKVRETIKDKSLAYADFVE